MKKIFISILLVMTLGLVGCVTINDNEKPTGTSTSATTVYCNICGQESKEISKFCSNCGEEAKWVTEKPSSKAKVQENNVVNKNNVSKVQESNVNKSPQKSYRDEYIRKLNATEENMSDLDYLYENGVTAELVTAEGTRYKRWDDMLNEIYGLLKVQLSDSEMDNVRNKQRQWIKYRDKTAENAANEFEGGSFAGVQYNSSLAELTKERCYELVSTYMK